MQIDLDVQIAVDALHLPQPEQIEQYIQTTLEQIQHDCVEM